MEDLKAYIESGVLELYVMGDLALTEQREVELMAAQHPEIKTELIQIEKSLESYAETNSIEPAEELRDNILAKMYNSSSSEAIVVPMSSTGSNNISFYKYGFAASLAFLFISLAALLTVYNRLQDSKQQLSQLQVANQTYASRVNLLDKQLGYSNVALTVLKDPGFTYIDLKGTAGAPKAKLLVAYNSDKKEVMIDLASMKMPANDTSHQYQLWAMVNGKPVDLGVFDSSTDSTGMIRMKAITNAQAFAVTLEPKGGSVNPSMDQMMAMGSV